MREIEDKNKAIAKKNAELADKAAERGGKPRVSSPS
jgi:hypothetical protein